MYYLYTYNPCAFSFGSCKQNGQTIPDWLAQPAAGFTERQHQPASRSLLSCIVATVVTQWIGSPDGYSVVLDNTISYSIIQLSHWSSAVGCYNYISGSFFIFQCLNGYYEVHGEMGKTRLLYHRAVISQNHIFMHRVQQQSNPCYGFGRYSSYDQLQSSVVAHCSRCIHFHPK